MERALGECRTKLASWQRGELTLLEAGSSTSQGCRRKQRGCRGQGSDSDDTFPPEVADVLRDDRRGRGDGVHDQRLGAARPDPRELRGHVLVGVLELVLVDDLDAGPLQHLGEPAARVLADRFERVLVPELNMGQLVKLIRITYLVPAESFPKVQGQPFKIAEVEERIRQMLES